MSRNIGRFTIFVNDYDEAIYFYKEKLGFEIIADQITPEHRFVHLGYNTQFPVGIWLWKADKTTAHLVGNQAADQPLLVIYTKDCISDYFNLEKQGVRFLNEPVQTDSEIYVHALDLYGNVILFVEMLEDKK
ncbi:MAG: VOC family protein [Rhodothermales bacterium]